MRVGAAGDVAARIASDLRREWKATKRGSADEAGFPEKDVLVCWKCLHAAHGTLGSLRSVSACRRPQKHYIDKNGLRNIFLPGHTFRSKKNSLNIKFLGGLFLGHPGPKRRDIPVKNFMQVALFCCFRQGVAGMSRDLGRDVPDLEKLYARKLWAHFSHPTHDNYIDFCRETNFLHVPLLPIAQSINYSYTKYCLDNFCCQVTITVA